MNRERERKKTELKCEWWNRLRIPFTFNFFIKKEIILFLCFYGLMVKRFNKDESKRASEFRVEARMGGAHCLSPCAKKLLKIKFFSHSHTHTQSNFMVRIRLFYTLLFALTLFSHLFSIFGLVWSVDGETKKEIYGNKQNKIQLKIELSTKLAR